MQREPGSEKAQSPSATSSADDKATSKKPGGQSRAGEHDDGAGELRWETVGPAAKSDEGGAPEGNVGGAGKAQIQSLVNGFEKKRVAVGESVKFQADDAGEWKSPNGVESLASFVTLTMPEVDTPAFKVTHTPKGKAPTSTTIAVVAPKSLQMTNVGEYPVQDFGAGMIAKVAPQPTDVSFGKVQWEESAEGDAAKPNVGEGFFQEVLKAGTHKLIHKPSGAIGFGENNDQVLDQCFIQDLKPLPNPQDPKDKTTPKWFAGSFSWTIPTNYIVPGGAGTKHKIQDVVQTFSMSNEGRLTITKLGASVSRQMGGKIEGALETFADAPNADAFLKRFAGNLPLVLQKAQEYMATSTDSKSKAHLVTALKAWKIKFYLDLHCKKNMSFWDDDVTITLSAGKSKTLPTVDGFGGSKKRQEQTVELNDIMDYNAIGAIKIDLSIEEGKYNLSHSLASPWKAESLSLNDNYMIHAHLTSG